MAAGEHIRLLLQDAGVDFEYVRHTLPEWKQLKQKQLTENIRAPTLPYITLEEKYYGKTGPILRFLSQKLNKYGGSNEDETHLLDVYTDIILDWSMQMAAYNWGIFTEDATKNYRDSTRPQLYKTFNDILSDTEGPFLLGENISYADFALFHILEDEPEVKFDAEALPYIANFLEAVANRPNLKIYLATDRK